LFVQNLDQLCALAAGKIGESRDSYRECVVLVVRLGKAKCRVGVGNRSIRVTAGSNQLCGVSGESQYINGVHECFSLFADSERNFDSQRR
jgi:hypothetical protein